VRGQTSRVGALLFGSGCCALVYQIGWLREFRLIFGASTAASAAVLAIFVGGLGLGSLLLGPRADRHPRPILFYSQLETIVAISAAASPFLLAMVRAAYVAIGGTSRLGLAAGTISRLALSAVVLAVPTIVMGGTLPAAARGVTRGTDTRRRDVAALYALNTLGAVVGAVVATFFLLELLGTRSTLWLAAATNLLIAVVARQVDRTLNPQNRPASEPIDLAVAHAILEPRDASAPAEFILLASATVGFAFFVMELVWYRMLGPLLGGSVFTFGLILAVALAGIGAGGLVYALVGHNRRPSLGGFAVSCLLEAAAMAAAYAFGDRLAVMAVVLLPLGHVGFAARVLGWTIVTAFVVLPPALVAGYQFPMLIGMFGSGREQVGRQVGLAYATNTLGALAGSLTGGFGLLPWLSAPGAWRFVAACLVVLGVGAAVLELRRGARRLLAPAAALAAITIAFLTSVGPTAAWRHSGIGAGRGLETIVSPNQLRSWRNGARRSVIWDGDGIESSVALAIQPSGYAFIVNGKSDGSARGDTSTMIMTGLLGAFLGHTPHRSLVIGLGSGASAGWLGALASMESVDVVELEPLILDVAAACQAVNAGVLNNPKVHIAIGDARERLLTSSAQYDLIASEPSNPFRSGVASLFTREYYEAARRRLSDEGVFLQWVQAYEIDARTLRTLFSTFASVFPYVETWQLGPDDLALVGSARPLGYSARSLAERMAEEPYKTGLAVAWHAVDVNGVLSHFLAGNRLTRAIAGVRDVELNTDDRNVVEFGFARSVGSSSILTNDVRDLARAIGDGRPRLVDEAAIDWAAVDTARVSFLSAENSAALANMVGDGPPTEVARRTALVNYYATGDFTGARTAWSRQPDPPRDPTEAAMVADLAAQAGDERALAIIDRLRPFQPGEADAILAELRIRQSRFDEAATALESSFREFRISPWAGFRFKLKALTLANVVAKHSPQVARRMYAALQEPFSVRAMEVDRLTTAAALSRMIDFEGLCRPVIAAAEPYVPWTFRFLAQRRECYDIVSDSRRTVAARELNEFLEVEPVALASGLSPR
jgi:spermidine synthase